MSENEDRNEKNNLSEEDLIFEAEEELPENSKGALKKLRDKLKECEKLKQEYLEGWQRTKADFINSKNKTEEEKESFAKYATKKIVTELIPVLDSFDIALKQKSLNEKNNTGKDWEKGVRNIYEQFKVIMEKNGVKEINPTIGSIFNPQEQEAVSLEATTDKNMDNKVVEIIQKGYKLNDRVIRAAKIKVGEYQS